MKKGSALLIVLGMLSFMLFSGLAFSIYMRQARLPSSFIRRTALTKQLAKAALAEAMAEINNGIGNYPHPGVFDPGNNEDWQNEDGTGSYIYNTFYRRVFLGAGADTGLYENNRENTLRNLLLDNMSDNVDDLTVSTLTLEGLAYLPPCLINEARVYSRRTPTAKWIPFAFEAGRYAYSAFDVSDYFDINRVPINAHRTSASSSRITLAHAFEDGSHTSSGGQGASTYETTIAGKQARQYPFVSLADWNLAMGSTPVGPKYPSPAMAYLLRQESEPCAITADDDEEDQKVSAYRMLTLVTDSNFIPETTTEKKDIENGEFQPFDWDELKQNSPKNLSAYMLKDGFKACWADHYLKFLSRLGGCALCDYLDEDSVPLSLVIPTTEKVPMICSLRPSVRDLTLKLVKSGNPENEAELLGAGGNGKPSDDPKQKSRDVSCWFTYEIDGAGLNCRGGAAVSAMALFPFPRNTEKANFQVDGQIALYFTKSGEDIPLVAQKIRISNDPVLTMDREPANSFNNGVIKLAVGQTVIPINGNGGKSDADMKKVMQDQLRIRGFDTIASFLPANNDASKPASKACVLRVLRQWKQTRQEKPDGSMSDWEPKQPAKDAEVVKAETGFGILGADGKPRAADITELAKEGANLEFNLAVWLRVKQQGGRGQAVDMVPAWMNDDSKQGLYSAGGRSSVAYQLLNADQQRILRFKFRANGDQKVLSLSPSELDDGLEKTLTLDASTIVCADPRFNHNPCNWFTVSGTDVRQAWEQNMHCTGDGRDGDYYMFVSNQGYLQSIYELAFIPKTTNPHDGILGADEICGDLKNQMAYGYPTDFPANFESCIDAHAMWHSYHPFKVGGYIDDFDQLNLTSGSGGQKVNPFSDSPAVVAAAFANTPLDWRAAATNAAVMSAIEFDVDEVDSFNNNYAWNEYNSTAKMPWFDGVMRLADAFQEKMRTCASYDAWVDGYNELWDGSGEDPKRLMGVEIDNAEFTSVDKKFFYGYWHDCFAAQQQLFLVFVRGEPMMMGGGVAGVAPPQLAARAVALVWRDPRPTEIDTDTRRAKPHAMRVLFYHPLD